MNGGDTGPDTGDDGTTPKPKAESEREQIKLQASYLNGIAIGIFVVGGFTIPTAIILNTSAGPWAAAFVVILCFCISPALHWVAKRSLRELDR